MRVSIFLPTGLYGKTVLPEHLSHNPFLWIKNVIDGGNPRHENTPNDSASIEPPPPSVRTATRRCRHCDKRYASLKFLAKHELTCGGVEAAGAGVRELCVCGSAKGLLILLSRKEGGGGFLPYLNRQSCCSPPLDLPRQKKKRISAIFIADINQPGPPATTFRISSDFRRI